MPTQTYDFSVPGDYTTTNVDLSGGNVQLATTATQGSVRGEQFFKGVQLVSVSAAETPNGGQVYYGLELDTVLSWHDGVAWVPSNGTPAELNTLAQLQANAVSALTLSRPIVKPYVLLARTMPSDPSPVVDDLVFEYEIAVPNQQLLLGNDLEVALNTGAGGVSSPGETRITLDPTKVLWTPGANDLFVFRNGVHQKLGVDYIEEDDTHIVFSYLVDSVPPFIDSLEFRSAQQGSSAYIPSPTHLKQADPPERPDNFGGIYSFV